jgi:hypothetical protein
MFLTRFNTIIHIFLSLDAFVKLRKETISFITSVYPSVHLFFCLSVRPSVRIEQLVSHWTDFYEIWYLGIFKKKSGEKIQVALHSEQNNGYFARIPIHIFITSRSVLLRMRTVSDRSCRENHTHIVRSVFFFRAVYEIKLKTR